VIEADEKLDVETPGDITREVVLVTRDGHTQVKVRVRARVRRAEEP
jgi:hypothetical protein